MKCWFVSAAVVLAFAAAPVVLADHMSPDGVGTASMPNDVHNTRLDVRLSDAPNECFLEVVQSGDLADSDNRCEYDATCVVYEHDENCEIVGELTDYR